MPKECKVCGKKKEHKTIYKANFFEKNGSATVVPLCYIHDLELFKIGQSKFTRKYNLEVEASDDMLDILGEESA